MKRLRIISTINDRVLPEEPKQRGTQIRFRVWLQKQEHFVWTSLFYGYHILMQHMHQPLPTHTDQVLRGLR